MFSALSQIYTVVTRPTHRGHTRPIPSRHTIRSTYDCFGRTCVRRIARHAAGLWISVMASSLGAGTVLAQTPPAQAPAASPPAARPDDTPSIRVGATLFADYTYTQSPEATDADGNTYNPSQFNVGRSYINITGNISHLVAFRLTPDIARETGTGSTLSGSLTLRVKYAYGQLNLDDWMQRGSWVRFGIQQTPW